MSKVGDRLGAILVPWGSARHVKICALPFFTLVFIAVNQYLGNPNYKSFSIRHSSRAPGQRLAALNYKSGNKILEGLSFL